MIKGSIECGMNGRIIKIAAKANKKDKIEKPQTTL
jgi:hypothetical protein